MSQKTRKTRSDLGNAEKRLRKAPADPALKAEVDRLRTEYRSETLREHIELVVNSAPPLTDAQRDQLGLLLRGAAA
jgi:hypothetical protein